MKSELVIYISYPTRLCRTIVNYLAFMHAGLKYYSPLFDAINCFNYRGPSTQMKVKHILKEKLDLGFEPEIERAHCAEVLIPRSPHVAPQLARAIRGGQKKKQNKKMK